MSAMWSVPQLISLECFFFLIAGGYLRRRPPGTEKRTALTVRNYSIPCDQQLACMTL